MACLLTLDFNASGTCKTSAGATEVLVTEFGNLVSYTKTANVITAITMATGTKFRRYRLDREKISTTDMLTVNAENGTFQYEPGVSYTINGFTSAMASEIRLQAMNRLIKIVKEVGGMYRIYGIDQGLDMVTADNKNEATLTGVKNTVLTFAGKETYWAYEVDSTIIAGLLVAAS